MTNDALDMNGHAGVPQENGIPTPEAVAERLGLRHVDSGDLSIRRRRCGRGWRYTGADQRAIRDAATIRRLNRLAVPPAYREVLYASDPAAHLQAIGRDAAGRLQYRYHPEWEKVREVRKARRLARLAKALPRISRSLAQHLGSAQPTRSFTAAAVIELVACSAIRAGEESYARMRDTRGAATLLKSDVAVRGARIRLTFRAKGGKTVSKEVDAARLARAILRLRRLPGERLFQYHAESGEIRQINAREVNGFLREIAGAKISLKDFRTLLACESVLDSLSRAEPAPNHRQRRKQVLHAVKAAAEDLANTPAICRRSYVHDAVVEAFENGVLGHCAPALKNCRSRTGRAQVLADIITGALA
ncbi:MAG: topoisomerase [Alphaproteobacteria bacterium]|jgi:DNA topoisomerase-1|nr:topoisomerase [Alphaproteobacteria bacterium]